MTELESGNHNLRQHAERAAVNMPIQGTAADIMKLAMIRVKHYLDGYEGDCTLLLQIHDELLFELPEATLPNVLPGIVECMETAYPMDVRIKADAKFGESWADMKALAN